jgi:hypothetical protein
MNKPSRKTRAAATRKNLRRTAEVLSNQAYAIFSHTRRRALLIVTFFFSVSVTLDPHQSHFVVPYTLVVMIIGLFLTLGTSESQKRNIALDMVIFTIANLLWLHCPHKQFEAVWRSDPIGIWISFKYLLVFALAWFGALIIEPIVKKGWKQDIALVFGALCLSVPLYHTYEEHQLEHRAVLCDSVNGDVCTVKPVCVQLDREKKICIQQDKPWYEPKNGDEDFFLTLMALLVVAAIKPSDKSPAHSSP